MRLGLVNCSHLGALLLRRLNHLVPIPDEITKTEQVTSTASATGSGVAVAGSRYGAGREGLPGGHEGRLVGGHGHAMEEGRVGADILRQLGLERTQMTLGG